MAQLLLDIKKPPLYSKESFVTSLCNINAYQWITSWPKENDQARFLCIYGDHGSGKTHLAHMWRQKTHAKFLNARLIEGKEPIDLMDQHRFYIIDDLHLAADETFLFHFYNLIQERRFYCLFTSVFSPATWSFKLPDLKSRLSSIVSIPIQKPDDDLLSDLAMKQFIEKGLKVHHKTVDYMLAHIERSFSAIRYAINLIDKKSTQQKKPITIPFVKEVLKL